MTNMRRYSDNEKRLRRRADMAAVILLFVLFIILMICNVAKGQTIPVTGTADTSAIEQRITDLEARILTLENGQIDPVPDPVPPSTDRRFGCNVGYKDDTTWSPEGIEKSDPRYIEYLKPVANCIRVEWWRSNDDINSAGTLTDERKVRIDRYIDIANECGSSIHVVLYVHDSEETIRWIVGRIRDRLTSGGTRYIEAPNEMWNGSNTTTGTAVWREIARLSGQPDYWTNGNTAFFKTTAQIASRILSIAKDEDPNCVTVLGCLTANTWWAENVEKYMTYKPDAHGLTFYFGSGYVDSSGNDTTPTSATVDQIFASAESYLPTEIANIQKHAAYSKSLGRRIVGYEGGPHWVVPLWKTDSCKTTWQNMNIANRDPRIVPLCERIATAAENAGYETLNWYNYMSLYDKYGSWGLGENLNTIQSNPKYQYAN